MRASENRMLYIAMFGISQNCTLFHKISQGSPLIGSARETFPVNVALKGKVDYEPKVILVT